MTSKLPEFYSLTPAQRAAYTLSPQQMATWERADALRQQGATPEQIASDPAIRQSYTPEQLALIDRVAARSKELPVAEKPAINSAFAHQMAMQRWEAADPSKMAELDLRNAQRDAGIKAMRDQAARLRAGPPAAQAPVTCPNCGHVFTPGQPAQAAPSPQPAIQPGRAYPTPPAG